MQSQILLKSNFKEKTINYDLGNDKVEKFPNVLLSRQIYGEIWILDITPVVQQLVKLISRISTL